MKRHHAVEINKLVGEMMLIFDRHFPTITGGSTLSHCKREMTKVRMQIAGFLNEHIDENVIKEQAEFVEWLKARGVYNEFDSGHMMQEKFRIWKLMKKDLKSVTG